MYIIDIQCKYYFYMAMSQSPIRLPPQGEMPLKLQAEAYPVYGRYAIPVLLVWTA